MSWKVGPISLPNPTMGPTFYPVQEGEVQKGVANIEKALNWIGYISPFIPVVGSLSGKIRMIGGTFEGAYGLATAVLHFGKAQWAKEKKAEREMTRMWESLEYTQHGLANFGRGLLEQVPVVNLGIPLLWDLPGSRMKYQAEKDYDVQQATEKAQKPAGSTVPKQAKSPRTERASSPVSPQPQTQAPKIEMGVFDRLLNTFSKFWNS